MISIVRTRPSQRHHARTHPQAWLLTRSVRRPQGEHTHAHPVCPPRQRPDHLERSSQVAAKPSSLEAKSSSVEVEPSPARPKIASVEAKSSSLTAKSSSLTAKSSSLTAEPSPPTANRRVFALRTTQAPSLTRHVTGQSWASPHEVDLSTSPGLNPRAEPGRKRSKTKGAEMVRYRGGQTLVIRLPKVSNGLADNDHKAQALSLERSDKPKGF
jgi:hypothetical protein